MGSIAVLYVVFKFNGDHNDDDDKEKRIMMRCKDNPDVII